MNFWPRLRCLRDAAAIPDTDLRALVPTAYEPHQASDREVTFQRMRAVARSDLAMLAALRKCMGRL